MSVSSDGVQAIKQLAAQFKYLTDFATELEGITSFETLATEAQAATAKAQADRDDMISQNATLNAQQDAVKTQTEQLMNDANSYVAASQKKADANYKAVMDAAQSKADSVKAAAQDQAKSLIDQANAQVATAQAALSDLNTQLTAAKADLAQVISDTEAGQVKLAAIKDSIAKLMAA